MTASETPVVEDPLLYTCDFFERHHDAVRKVVDALGLQQTDLTLRASENDSHTECLDVKQNILRTFIRDGVWHLYRLPRIAIDACGYVLAVNLPAIEMLAQQGISEQQVLNMTPEELFFSKRGATTDAETCISDGLLRQKLPGREPKMYLFNGLNNCYFAVDVLLGPRPQESTFVSFDDEGLGLLLARHEATHGDREPARATAWERHHKSYSGHSVLVRNIAEKIAMHFCPNNTSLAHEFDRAAIWHDSGKDGWSEEILTGKSPVPASLVQDHTFLGAYSVARSQSLVVRMGALLHHEQYAHHGDTSVSLKDGTPERKGYFGLTGKKEIPFVGRVLRVADTVATMTAERPYNNKKSTPQEIIDQLKEGAEYDYQPDIALLVADNLKEFCPEAYH